MIPEYFGACCSPFLSKFPVFQVVGSVFSGEKALEFISRSPPDLITLDVEMPGMSGLETLREIAKRNAQAKPLPPVDTILVSALAKSGRHMVLRSDNGAARISLSEAPPEKGCRPSANVFLRSAAIVYGSRLAWPCLRTSSTSCRLDLNRSHDGIIYNRWPTSFDDLTNGTTAVFATKSLKR